MKTITNKDLAQVIGGISAAWLNAIVRMFNTIIDFGTKIGSSLRRGKKKNYC